MGIDPDAYMAGAIPSLSRGGSWRQDDQSSANSQSVTSYGHAPGGSIFPRPSQIVPQPAPSLGGNRGNPHFAQVQHPWAVRPPFARPHPGPLSLRAMTPMTGGTVAAQSSTGGGSTASGKAPSAGPTKHPGWANLHAGGYKSSPTSPTIAAGATFIASQATSQYGVKPPPSHRTTPLVSPRLVGPIWEYDSGSPKPMTAEPDYFTLPASPGMVSAPHTPTGNHQDSLPPPPRPAPGPQSPRPKLDSNKPPRPSLSRRHTHDRYSPEMLAAIERAEKSGKVDSKSLGRVRVRSGLRKPTFDIGSEAGESYYAPSSKTYAHSVDPSSSSIGTGMSTTGHSRSTPRPAPTRRSTAGQSALSTVNGSTRSFAEKRLKNRSHPALSTIVSTPDFSQTAPSTPTTKHHKDRSRPTLSRGGSTVDFTQTAPSTPLPNEPRQQPPRPALARGTSTVDFTQTAPNSPTSRVPARSQHPSMDLRSLQSALPDIDHPLPTAPVRASGYIPPSTDDGDGYDRYTAHPAAPTPRRAEPSSRPTGADPPRGAGLNHVTADTYRPPGLPKPNKEIPWNRDGPAMRTYGIAWLREGDVEALPGGPAGPRWIQARPPASAAVAQSGDSWWESGAS